MRVKLVENRASGQVTRKSAITARPTPAPTAAPWTAATIGLPVFQSRCASLYKCRPRFAVRITPSGPRLTKSAPAQKCFPSAHRTIAHARNLVINVERVSDFSDHIGVDEIVWSTPYLD